MEKVAIQGIMVLEESMHGTALEKSSWDRIATNPFLR
jgi:hypothetical protein